MSWNWSNLTFRQCHKCGYESDELEDFVKDSRYDYGRKNLCKWCSNHNMAHIEIVRRRRVKLRSVVDRLKEAPCTDCNKTYPPCVMDFHHIDPNKKEFAIYEAIGKNYPLPRVLKEIEKCVVLCANCHRIRTHNDRRNKYSSHDLYEGGEAWV